VRLEGFPLRLVRENISYDVDKVLRPEPAEDMMLSQALIHPGLDLQDLNDCNMFSFRVLFDLLQLD